MATELSRRNLLKGLAASAVVVGWSHSRHSWITAAEAGPVEMSDVPLLDGTLTSAVPGTGGFSSDFGHQVDRTPTAVLRPGSVQDISKMVKYARRNGLKVAMNGQSGPPDKPESHSNYGQALVQGGISVDAKSLSTIYAVDATGADVGAGVTWASLLTAALPGSTPPVLTDFLHLSIGGTLSVGGIGGTVQKFGSQADNVEALQVVTGKGDIVTCSPDQKPELFNSVLAGAGQCGIVTRARVRLMPAETNALIFNLYYDSLQAFVADQITVMRDGRFSHQQGQIERKPDDSGWRYVMEAASYYTPPNLPNREALLSGLSDDRSSMVSLELPFSVWAFRLDPIVGQLRAAGFWEQPHPWLSLFVPASEAVPYVDNVVSRLTAADLGAGRALLYPVDPSKFRTPLFQIARGAEPAAFQLSLLRFPFPGYPGIPGMLSQNRAFYDDAVRRGGKRYLIGAIPDMTAGDWRAHFGSQWDFLREAKGKFDPDNVLTPGQGIFT